MRKYIGMFLLLLIGFFSETGKADEEPYTELIGESIVTNVDESNAAWGKALRLMPAVFLLAETVILFYSVFARQTRLFSALSDLACFLTSLMILSKQTARK